MLVSPVLVLKLGLEGCDLELGLLRGGLIGPALFL